MYAECAAGMRAWACVVETLHQANGFHTLAHQQLRHLLTAVLVFQQVKLEATSHSSSLAYLDLSKIPPQDRKEGRKEVFPLFMPSRAS